METFWAIKYTKPDIGFFTTGHGAPGPRLSPLMLPVLILRSKTMPFAEYSIAASEQHGKSAARKVTGVSASSCVK